MKKLGNTLVEIFTCNPEFKRFFSSCISSLWQAYGDREIVFQLLISTDVTITTYSNITMTNHANIIH
jgi:hypothetical protein